jgi:predicted transcriptional regulator
MHTNYSNHRGVTVRARREKVGLTRVQLAVRAALSVTHLANIEAGVIPAGGAAFGRVLDALSVAEAEKKSSPEVATSGSTNLPVQAGDHGEG